MKNIHKRSDRYISLSPNQGNLEKQMSELIQMQNLLSSKLSIVTTNIQNDVSSFVNKNRPYLAADINVLDIQNSLFGTGNNFFEFSCEFRQLFQSIQSEIKGVIQVLEKFSFTKSLSLFITRGILQNFIRLNFMTLDRQQLLHKIINKILQSVLNGKSIYSLNFDQNNLCQKCYILIKQMNQCLWTQPFLQQLILLKRHFSCRQTQQNRLKMAVNTQKKNENLCKQQISYNKTDDKENNNEMNQSLNVGVENKKISLFLQPIIKKLYEKQIESKRNILQPNNKNRTSRQQINSSINNITDHAAEYNINYESQVIRSIKVSNPCLDTKQLALDSRVLDVSINKQFQCFRPSIRAKPDYKQILNNTPITFQTQFASKKTITFSKYKLPQLKSLADSNFNKNKNSYSDKSLANPNYKLETNTQMLKGYVSEHPSYPIQKQKAINLKQRSSKEKINKKIGKILSLTGIKKTQQDQPSIKKNTLKLPSLSNNEKAQMQYNKSLQKLKNLQRLRADPYKNSTLLTKKKRKKRHFSQQVLGLDSLFENSNIAISSENNFESMPKMKKKKEYIIDYIPKVQQQVVSRCKQDYEKIISNQIECLFDFKASISKSISLTQLSQQKKKKNYFKTIILGKPFNHKKQHASKLQLSSQEISLSTKLYTVMAAIKSANIELYKLIRQKLEKQSVKSNCDDGCVGFGNGERANHFPMSLLTKKSQIANSSFEFKKKANLHTIYINSNDLDQQSCLKNQSKQSQETQLRMIINQVIINHRESCSQSIRRQQKQKSQPMNYCNHISKFYQFLIQFSKAKSIKT